MGELLQEFLSRYREVMREAHREGIAELLKRKDIVQMTLLENGQKALIAYNLEQTRQQDSSQDQSKPS